MVAWQFAELNKVTCWLVMFKNLSSQSSETVNNCDTPPLIVPLLVLATLKIGSNKYTQEWWSCQGEFRKNCFCAN